MVARGGIEPPTRGFSVLEARSGGRMLTRDVTSSIPKFQIVRHSSTLNHAWPRDRSRSYPEVTPTKPVAPGLPESMSSARERRPTHGWAAFRKCLGTTRRPNVSARTAKVDVSIYTASGHVHSCSLRCTDHPHV